jgi:hypothetical protein
MMKKGTEPRKLGLRELANIIIFICDRLETGRMEINIYFWGDSTYWRHRTFDLLDGLFDILDRMMKLDMINVLLGFNAKVGSLLRQMKFELKEKITAPYSCSLEVVRNNEELLDKMCMEFEEIWSPLFRKSSG